MENFRGIRIKRVTEADLLTLQGIPIHAKPEPKAEVKAEVKPEPKAEVKPVIEVGFIPEESVADYEEKADAFQDAEDKADAEEAMKVLAENEPTVSLEEVKQTLAEEETPVSDSKEAPAETSKKKQRRK